MGRAGADPRGGERAGRHPGRGVVPALPRAPADGGAGVRHGCTDCHRFHNQANPLQGLGTKDRDGKNKLTINEWLGGGR